MEIWGGGGCSDSVNRLNDELAWETMIRQECATVWIEALPVILMGKRREISFMPTSGHIGERFD